MAISNHIIIFALHNSRVQSNPGVGAYDDTMGPMGNSLVLVIHLGLF